MGLLDSLFGDQRMSDPVRGSAQVVSCSANRGRGVYQSCHLQLVVQAEGVPARAVEQQTLVHRSRWPVPGMTLPATVDRANRPVRIEWDELPDARDRPGRPPRGWPPHADNAAAAAAAATPGSSQPLRRQAPAAARWSATRRDLHNGRAGVVTPGSADGADGARTRDLHTASVALSQLSYSPREGQV